MRGQNPRTRTRFCASHEPGTASIMASACTAWRLAGARQREPTPAQPCAFHPYKCTEGRCNNRRALATEPEISSFLKDVERRAFKRALYQVRDDEAALDIVQDAMMKLVEHYSDKPVAELPMLFQRILSNCVLDWFRRQKTRNALFSNLSDFESESDDGEFDLLESFLSRAESDLGDSSETEAQRAQILLCIDESIQDLPTRQREAFLLRYWEEMDVAETAAAMGCSEGSVKTHCSRAVAALAKALTIKGLKP